MAKDGAHVIFYRPRVDALPACVLLTKIGHTSPRDRGFWGLPGGCIEEGETAEEAAVREVGEELDGVGDCFESLRLLPSLQPYKGIEGATIHYFFRGSHDMELDRVRLKRSPNGVVEADGLGWFSEWEVLAVCMRETDKAAVLEVFKYTKCGEVWKKDGLTSQS